MWKNKNKEISKISSHSPLGFEDKLESIKSVFKKAYTDASTLIDDITSEVSAKEEEIRIIQANIDNMNETKNRTKEFVNNIEKLI